MTQFHPKKWPIFRIISIRNWFWGNCGVSIKQTAILKNRARRSQIPTSPLSRRIQRRWPFLQDMSSNFKKYIVKSVSDICRSFIRKNDLFFGWLASETDFEETAVYRKNKLLSWRNGQRRWIRLAKRLVGIWEQRARFSGSPGQTRLRRCWNLHFRFSESVYYKRWP